MKKKLKQLETYIHSLFTHLHYHPEVSWNEKETAAFILQRLSEDGFKCTPFPSFPGLIAEIGSGKPVIAIRADMDALWQEKDGTHQAVHSCGHDAHMSIVLGTAALLKESIGHLKGTIRFIFQPAEETGEGAIAVTKLGFVDDVDFLYGIHLRPIEELPLGAAAPAISHGASHHVLGKIIGEDAHGARPHLGTSAIEAGMMLHQLLSQIKLSPMNPHSVKLTRFEAGGENLNIIPGTAIFGIDARAQTNEDLDYLKSEIQRTFQALEEWYGITIEHEQQPDTTASIISKEACCHMETAIIDTLGRKGLSKTIFTPGSDDFHFYTKLRPNIKATMLALGADLTPGLHHPHMIFDHSCLVIGAEILTRAVLETMKAES
ncbi:amidohydrolase [Pradoshia sp.]